MSLRTVLGLKVMSSGQEKFRVEINWLALFVGRPSFSSVVQSSVCSSTELEGQHWVTLTRLPDGYSKIWLCLFCPSGFKDYGSATLRCKIWSLPFLGRDQILPSGNTDLEARFLHHHLQVCLFSLKKESCVFLRLSLIFLSSFSSYDLPSATLRLLLTQFGSLDQGLGKYFRF